MKLPGYAAVYSILITATALELIIIGQPIPYSTVILSIILLAGLKAILIAMYFQHLRYEQISLSLLALIGFIAGITFLILSIGSVVHIRLLPLP